MGKQRLTITLSESILKKVDKYIDGVQIRNRSHAIESLLENSFSPSIDTAVILAGGHQASSDIPALKKIGDRSVLAITLEKLRDIGIDRVIVCAGAVTEPIKAEFGDGSTMGLSLLYTEEPEELGTAGALKIAEKFLTEDPFLVIHADVLSDLDLADLVEFHLQENAAATIAVKPAMGTKELGHVHLSGNRIDAFLDSSEKRGISIINTGMYILDPVVLAQITPNSKLFLEKDIFPSLARQGELSAFVFQGNWFDVTKNERLEEAADVWEQDKD